MRTKGVIYVAIATVLLVFGYIWRRHHDAKVDAQVLSTRLPRNDKAKYIIDEKKHQVIEISEGPKGPTDKEVIKRRFLAPRSSVEVRKDGSIVVTSRQWGSEFAPFVGVSMDSEIRGRGLVGANLFYVKRWELGGGLSLDVQRLRDPRVFFAVSFNAYANTLLFVGVDNHKAASVGVALKF